jgi:hypothetical protein
VAVDFDIRQVQPFTLKKKLNPEFNPEASCCFLARQRVSNLRTLNAQQVMEDAIDSVASKALGKVKP